jgi:crotonobetainyl-CoA:carnitine CoA-transferase CaiB-like acyl-CoA transferase
MTFPLEGLRVLDMTVFQQGTYSTAMLADLGADVIKIEGPDSPDLGRWSSAVEAREPLNSYFQTLNRNKRGIVLDLKLEKGRTVFHRLAEEADVFVSNLRRPALARIGADYETLSKINPSIIYGRASGYGPYGPDSDLASMDILGQARGGIMSRTGEPDGPPRPAGVPIADHVGAMSLAFGIMVALYHRERTGEGQQVDGSLLGGQICIQSHNITDYLWSGKLVNRRERVGPNPTWSTYQGSDGKWFVIGMNRQHYWAPFCKTIGRPEWIDIEKYATLEARLAHRDELFGELDRFFATRPAAHWVKLFSDADLLATPVNDYADLASDPQVVENGYISVIERGDGEPPLRMVGPPVILSKTPAKLRHLAPEFGQHTEEVLLEAGYDWQEIAELRSAGAIGPRVTSEAASS